MSGRRRRFVFMVLDGVGAGASPDADAFGDEGSDTLGNLSRLVDLRLPTLQGLGLGNLHPIRGVPPAPTPQALPGRLAERSAGKDTTNGHWEHMGLVTEEPFPTYPNGFPEDVLRPFRSRTGRDILGNKPASGTEIIAELGEEHLASGRPIVYTSADSVFQIACHVEVVSLEELYEFCRVARDILTGPHAVARVIARPFAGSPGAFYRTPDRRDFSLPPIGPTYLDLLVERGVPVTGLGKIPQIFAGRGITAERTVKDNAANLEALIGLLRGGAEGLVFTNLVDFDMLWGHRNDADGFAAGLEAVDSMLPRVLELLEAGDRLLITADHGVDPTTVSTDHSREYVPVLYYPRPRGTPAASYEGWMADSGASAFAHLTAERPPLGGAPLEELQPARGWRSYPTVHACRPTEPCSVGKHEAAEAAVFLRRHFGAAPPVAMVLGSGLGRLTQSLDVRETLGCEEIPHWPLGGVVGHSSRVLVAERRTIGGATPLAVLSGRVHGYEGFDLGQQQLPVRTLAAWGVRHLLLTNAAGSLDTTLVPGTVAVVTYILDTQSEAPDGGPSGFQATPVRLAGTLAEVTLPQQSLLPVVTYAALPGPQYETRAEVEVLRGLDAQVVGMSTAAEARAAVEEGLSLAVLSVVTNQAADDPGGGSAAHAQVVDVSDAAVPRLLPLLDALLDTWCGSADGTGTYVTTASAPSSDPVDPASIHADPQDPHG